MAKVITYSRKFPSYHPKAGQPTYFVEKVLNSLGIDYHSEQYLFQLYELNKHNEKLSRDDLVSFYLNVGMFNETSIEKPHTIRNGHRWKEGDMFSPRVWSGKPYNSPQIIFAPDQKVVRTYGFEKKWTCHSGMAPFVNGRLFNPDNLHDVAENDGLDYNDLLSWFKWSNGKGFDGQIICWKDPKY